MINEWEKHEGVLLQAIPYLGHRILKVFTPKAGLISLIAKHIKAKNAGLTTAFCRAEWVLGKTHSDIHPLKEATLIDPLPHLRERYDTLMAAGSIAGDLIRSQFPNRSAQILYDLLIASFQHLPQNPTAIAQSFRLKLLKFEGLLRLHPTCMRCDQIASHLSLGECLCSAHAATGSIAFDSQEWQMLLALGHGRRFSDLATLTPSKALMEKISLLFLNLSR